MVEIKAENRVERFLICNWKKILAGLFILLIVVVNVRVHNPQIEFGEYRFNCVYNGSELEFTGRHEVELGQFNYQISEPIVVKYKNHIWKPGFLAVQDPTDDCKIYAQDTLSYGELKDQGENQQS